MRYTSGVGPRRLYLHLGTPKTGTTYLQELLWHHRRVLARHGLHYPGRVPEAHFLAAQDLQRMSFNDWPDPMASGAWPRLVDEVRRRSGTVVLSHELFGDASPADAQRALQDLSFTEVHLVVTARDLARQVPAVWQEDLKNRHHWAYEDFLTAVRPGSGVRTWFGEAFWSRQDVPRVLDRWAGGLRPSHVHVVTVPQPGQPRDVLWRRFASVVGVDPGLVDASHELRTNRSLDALEAALMRRLNSAVAGTVDWPVYGRAVEHVAGEVFGGRDRGRIVLPERDHAWAQQKGAEMVRVLAGRGYDVVGDLEELQVGPPEPQGRHPDRVDDGELLEVAVQALGELLFRNPLPPPEPRGAELAQQLALRAARGVRERARKRVRAVRRSV